MPEITNLLMNGSLDPLSFGLSRTEVEFSLGKAEGDYEYEGVHIEKRGPFQLHYEKGQLFSVNWLLSDQGELPIAITGNHPKTTTTLEQFLDFCNEGAIPWTIDQSQSFDRQLAIRTCPNVVAIFDLDFREMQRIIVTGNHAAWREELR